VADRRKAPARDRHHPFPVPESPLQSDLRVTGGPDRRLEPGATATWQIPATLLERRVGLAVWILLGGVLLVLGNV